MKTLFLLIALMGITVLTPAATLLQPENSALTEVIGGEKKYVSFTLHNKSLKSIPLQIPGVMNPNLSPVSNSGVDLVVGQKILFKYKGKKRELLVVSSELEGQVVEVSQLLKERKKEIDEAKGK